MDVTLAAETGRRSGTGTARRLRREGKVPGVVYGLGSEVVAIAVNWPDLRAALTTDAGLNALIELEVAGESNLTIVKDLQRHPVGRQVVHVDFIRIDREAAIEVEVPIILTGEAEDLIQEGGLVDQLLYSLTIQAKPGSIPNELVVDIGVLTLDAAVKVGDIALPSGVETEIDADEPVVTAYIPRVVEEETPEDELEEGEELPEGEEGATAEEGGEDAADDSES
jgi:large subunit ribosomal protein L25